MTATSKRWAALLAAALVMTLIAAGGCAKKGREAKGPSEGKGAAEAPAAPAKKTEPAPAVKKEPSAPGAGQAESAGTASKEVSSEGARPDAGSGEERPYEGILAIVIDDFGYRSAATEKILALAEPITCAVLPDGKTTAEDARDAKAAGKLVILHMPMEAIDQSKSNGDGFIKSGMEAGEVRAKLHEALRNVPMAEGVSNHMGSRISTDEQVLEAILEEVDDLGLFYLDSRTTSDTLGPKVAGKVGARAFMNSLFIDSVDDVSYVEGKLWEAAKKAKENGQAAVIGHVRASTAEALANVLPLMAENGIKLVFLDELDPL
ncbi:MAG TPA: divergent polysaccharide deacetylase family protein [Bacillota bacterium]|nr:MAG: Divergent polysaccharide deacetylase [Firmicutes bacterium ADurb.Bin153]HNV34778.1 divergent polysaccharide deacetylase family protein [Bacillota bacterium]